MAKKENLQKKQAAHPAQDKKFPIVGMGASAGGLEAFEAFFSAMPKDSGMAFVLISHLDPTHISLLPDLIQKKTEMAVLLIEDGLQIQPNTAYVIPPNKDVAILNGVLHLMDLPRPRGFNLPIDNFFKSLALDQGANAVCIILSGTGSDGSLGLKQIKGELGMVMVQDEASAKYDGMPRSAIATGFADYVLPVEKMPEALMKYARHAIIEPGNKVGTDEEKFHKALQKIYILLRSHTNQDFSLYKKNTIIRRIERRMNVHQISNINDYVTYLAKSEREVHILFKDLLIGVTGFFRDPEAFDVLQETFLPNLLADKSEDAGVRIWVPGCSTGEEAYSLAIVLQECMEKMNRHFTIQIFATDLDEDAINAARSGLYPVSIASDVHPERIKRFFTREDSFFRVKKAIREMLVFAPQNLIKDPPFTKLDMLSCRNLLIYLGPELQKKLLPMFYYSLKPDGILFLGSAESVGQETNLFECSDKKWKIFKRQPHQENARPALKFPISAPMEMDNSLEIKIPEAVKRAEEINAFMLVETILQQSDTPPCVIIDEKSDIVYVHGRTGKYLEPAAGRMSSNILEMARPGLKIALTSAIRKAATLRHEVIQNGIDIENNGGFITINLKVKPILEYGAIRGMLMVVFHDVVKTKQKTTSRVSQKNQTVIHLEQELQHTRENLQTTIEELETSNEELKSTNEELQSTNEELQSTNEELETSKEELQSLNEESATVNAELQSRIDELSDANDDMKNLLNSTQIGTIFLNMDLNIRRFTDMATRLIPLAVTDIGRPISHFASELRDFQLADHARQVLKDLITQEFEVESQSGQFFRTRIMPYRTMQNVIDGVVVTFEDITEFKKFRWTAQRLSVMVNSSEAVIIQDEDGAITFWNTGAEKLYGFTEAEALAMNFCHLVPEEQEESFRSFMKTVISEGRSPVFKTQRLSKNKTRISVGIIAAALRDEKSGINSMITIERDIKEWPANSVKR
ncbi:chemotaxis protein CheB [Desulfobacter vibrioformis]|uniref:chemotaxis protein CheB n=1 Tax=Desulfobacter vibrioformis TaxID=34031 RepID=UPI00068FFA1E|nr:chemotaxis protein CheB [Desulfobacter vibrioformis]